MGDAAPAGQQGPDVAARLGLLQPAERDPHPGHRDVFRVVGREHEKQPGVGAAFVQLTGGVEVARPEAERRREAERPGPGAPHRREPGGDLGARRQVGEDREVVARARGAAQRLRRQRRERRRRPVAGLGQLGARQRFRGFHVGLIERVHAERLAERVRGVFPVQELGAQIERIGRERTRDLRVVARRGDRVVHDRDHPAPLLSRALGHELLDPVRQPGDRRGRAQHEFVATLPSLGGERRAGGRGPRRVHGAGALAQGPAVDPHQGGGEHADDGERRVASAHVGGMGEHRAAPALARQRFQRGPRLGDHGELLGLRVPREVGVKRERLDRRAGLAGDQEQRAREVGGAGDAQHRGGVGAVEHREGGGPEARREDLGRETRTAHSADDDAAEPVAAHLGGEARELVPLRERDAGRLDPSELAHRSRNITRPRRVRRGQLG